MNKNVECELALIGDAKLTLEALLPAVEAELGRRARDPDPVVREIEEVREPWLAKWMPKLTSDETPLNPYRVIWDLAHTVDLDNTIITHDAGSPRDQISPFWKATKPLSYIGWGKTTQLGYGLGLAMGAKLARPDQLCINLWGDAAIGFTGMDFETAVRERIPILSILLNNFSMAIELKIMPVSTERYRSTDISGDYAAMARAFGGYGERVTTPDEIIPAIQRGIEQTRNGLRRCSSSSPARKSRSPSTNRQAPRRSSGQLRPVRLASGFLTRLQALEIVLGEVDLELDPHRQMVGDLPGPPFVAIVGLDRRLFWRLSAFGLDLIGRQMPAIGPKVRVVVAEHRALELEHA